MKATRDLPLWGAGRRRLGHRTSPFHPARRVGGEIHMGDHHHRRLQGGGARAAVLGVSDGLLTNVLLVLGFVGANPGPGVVRFAGVFGLIAGAVSMAAGEYVSMRAQRELLEAELALERREISQRPEGERRELVRIYENRGVEPGVARTLASEMMRTPELALDTHAREELGIDPGGLGNPLQAAAASFSTFAVGALVPLVPWLVTRGTAATVASLVAGGLAALGVGAALAVYTRLNLWWTALRQFVFVAAVAAAGYGIGAALGVSVHG